MLSIYTTWLYPCNIPKINIHCHLIVLKYMLWSYLFTMMIKSAVPIDTWFDTILIEPCGKKDTGNKHTLISSNHIIRLIFYWGSCFRMTVSFGVSLFCGCGRVGVCWILGVGGWLGCGCLGCGGWIALCWVYDCVLHPPPLGDRAECALLSSDLLGMLEMWIPWYEHIWFSVWFLYF